MNICMISPTCYPPNARGLEIHVRNLSQKLAKLGHTVHLISTNVNEGENTSNIQEYKVPSTKNEFFNSIVFSIWVLIYMTRIGNEKIDVYHFHGAPYLKLFGELIFKLKKKRVVYTIHGSFTPTLRTKFLFTAIGQNVKIIAVSDNIRKLLTSEYLISDVSSVPTGIHLSHFKDINGNGRHGNIILFVGCLTKDKGVNYLIECMTEVWKRYRNARLIIVGDGPMKEELITRSEEISSLGNIEFKGQIKHEDIPYLMDGADLFVLPSIRTTDSIEGTPTVLIEAMAAGLPIVASSVGGIPEMIKNRENGLLVGEKKSLDLAEKICQILANPELRSLCGNNNKAECKRYDWDLVIEKIFNAYDVVETPANLRH